MDRNQENITNHQNLSGFWNFTEDIEPASERTLTNISFGLGCCITVLNVSTMCLLLRHRDCIGGNGFFQQLVFLCSTDILSGVALTLPHFGHLFIEMQTDIYYAFCTIGLILLQLSLTLSVGNCFIISILRYMIMKNIDNPVSIWYKHATFFMIIGNLLISVLTVCSSVMVVTFHFGFQPVEFCDKINNVGKDEYKLTYIVGGVIIVVLFLVGTNISTALCIVKLKRTNQPAMSSSSEANRYATTTFILIVSALNLTIVPGMLFWVATVNVSLNVSPEATEIISRFISINSLLNPFIYCLRSTKFRSAVWKDVEAISSRLRCTSNTQ